MLLFIVEDDSIAFLWGGFELCAVSRSAVGLFEFFLLTCVMFVLADRWGRGEGQEWRAERG